MPLENKILLKRHDTTKLLHVYQTSMSIYFNYLNDTIDFQWYNNN